MEIGKMINQLSNRLRRRSSNAQSRIGIGSSQGAILGYILVTSPKRAVYQKDVEQEFGLRPSTATEFLKSLEQKGFIERIPDEQDARRKKLIFTEQGAKMKRVLLSEIRGTEELLTRGIAAEEIAVFLDIAGRMLANLDADPDTHSLQERKIQ